MPIATSSRRAYSASRATIPMPRCRCRTRCTSWPAPARGASARAGSRPRPIGWSIPSGARAGRCSAPAAMNTSLSGSRERSGSDARRSSSTTTAWSVRSTSTTYDGRAHLERQACALVMRSTFLRPSFETPRSSRCEAPQDEGFCCGLRARKSSRPSTDLMVRSPRAARASRTMAAQRFVSSQPVLANRRLHARLQLPGMVR